MTTPNEFRASAFDSVLPGSASRLPLGDRNAVRDMLRILGAEGGTAGVPAPVRRLHPGETLFHEGAAPDFLYFVRSGTFKTFRTELDGYEQVLGFIGRTEVLGYDAVCMAEHPTGAAALEDSTVYALPARDLSTLDENCPGASRLVQLAASVALNRQAELADVMSAAASEVRLARFLLHMSRRMEALGESPRRLLLRMSRRDIASHLGVAHETVSRSFQSLSDWGLLTVRNREVGIVDAHALTVFAQGTRRQSGGEALRARRSAVRSATERARVGLSVVNSR